MQDPVSLTRAVEMLAERGDAVSLPTLSRYVRSHADALTPVIDGRKIMVDFDTLYQHRRENIRLGPPKAPPPSAFSGTRSDEAAGNLRAQRRLRELDLAEREKDLVPRIEVEEAAVAAVSAMRNALALALADTSEAIAAATGTEARIVRPHLRTFERKGLETFIRTLTDHGLVEEGAASA